MSSALEIVDAGQDDFSFCFPSKVAYKGYKKLGYSDAVTIPYYVLFGDMRSNAP